MKFVLEKNNKYCGKKINSALIKSGCFAVTTCLILLQSSSSFIKVEPKKIETNYVPNIIIETYTTKDYSNCTPYLEEFGIVKKDSKLKINSTFNPSEDLLDRFDSTINAYPKVNGFYVETIDGDFSFGYNEDVTIFAASSVKALYSLYCHKEIKKGNASFDEMLTYEERFRRGGSGIMKNKATIGEKYSIRYLLHECIDTSDNIAFMMLQDRFGKEGYNQMISELGCEKSILAPGRQWIDSSPRELVTVWREIHNFNENDEEKNFYNDLDNAQYNILDEVVSDNTLHKSGWATDSYHEVGIVYGDKPYIISVMTKSDGYQIDQKYVIDIIALCDELVNEYAKENSKKYLLVDNLN